MPVNPSELWVNTDVVGANRQQLQAECTSVPAAPSAATERKKNIFVFSPSSSFTTHAHVFSSA